MRRYMFTDFMFSMIVGLAFGVGIFVLLYSLSCFITFSIMPMSWALFRASMVMGCLSGIGLFCKTL